MSIDYSAMAFPKASWTQQEKRQKKPQNRKVAPVQRKKEALQEGAKHHAGQKREKMLLEYAPGQ